MACGSVPTHGGGPCGCSGLCDGGCVACTSCSGSCNAACAGDCSGSCSGSCRGGCTSCDGCSGTCLGACQGSCKSSCNFGCNSGAKQDLYNRLKQLGLHEYIEANNVQDIIDLVIYELKRRKNINGTADSLSAGTTTVIDSYFNHIQSNLQQLSYTTNYNNIQDSHILRAMAQELIDFALDSYGKIVPIYDAPR